MIKAIVEKGLSRSVAADPVAYLKLISAMSKHLTVDATLSDAEIRSTALSVKLDSKDIVSVQAPISGYGTTETGESVDLVDAPQLKKLAIALAEDKMGSYVKKAQS